MDGVYRATFTASCQLDISLDFLPLFALAEDRHERTDYASKRRKDGPRIMSEPEHALDGIYLQRLKYYHYHNKQSSQWQKAQEAAFASSTIPSSRRKSLGLLKMLAQSASRPNC